MLIEFYYENIPHETVFKWKKHGKGYMYISFINNVIILLLMELIKCISATCMILKKKKDYLYSFNS